MLFCSFAHLLIRSIAILVTRSLTHSLARSLAHLLTHSIACSFTHSLTYSLRHSLARLLTYSLDLLLFYSFAYLFIYSLNRSLTHLLTHSYTRIALNNCCLYAGFVTCYLSLLPLTLVTSTHCTLFMQLPCVQFVHIRFLITMCYCAHVFTGIPPRLSDPCNFITVPLVTRQLEQTTLLF